MLDHCCRPAGTFWSGHRTQIVALAHACVEACFTDASSIGLTKSPAMKEPMKTGSMTLSGLTSVPRGAKFQARWK